MLYSVRRILKFNSRSWAKFKKTSSLPEDVLNNAVVKEIDEDDLILVDENRLTTKIDNRNK